MRLLSSLFALAFACATARAQSIKVNALMPSTYAAPAAQEITLSSTDGDFVAGDLVEFLLASNFPAPGCSAPGTGNTVVFDSANQVRVTPTPTLVSGAYRVCYESAGVVDLQDDVVLVVQTTPTLITNSAPQADVELLNSSVTFTGGVAGSLYAFVPVGDACPSEVSGDADAPTAFPYAGSYDLCYDEGGRGGPGLQTTQSPFLTVATSPVIIQNGVRVTSTLTAPLVFLDYAQLGSMYEFVAVGGPCPGTLGNTVDAYGRAQAPSAEGDYDLCFDSGGGNGIELQTDSSPYLRVAPLLTWDEYTSNNFTLELTEHFSGSLDVDRLHVAGGYDGVTMSAPYGRFFELDVTGTGNWTELVSISTGFERLGSRGEIINGRLIGFGGFDGSTAVASTVVYDPATPTYWGGVTSTGAPPDRYDHCTATVGNTIYFFGGRDETGMYNDFWSVDFSNPSGLVTFVQEYPGPGGISRRTSPACAVAGPERTKIYIWGGYNYQTGEVFSDLWEWDTVANTTTLVTPLNTGPTARFQAAYASVNGRFVIHGGQNPNLSPPNNYFSDMWEYDAFLNRWHEVEYTTPSGSPDRRASHTLTVIQADVSVPIGEGQMAIMGGTRDGITLGDIWLTDYRPRFCAPGYFSEDGINECEACPPGTAADQYGSYSCTDCTAGTYAQGYANTACTECLGGYYSATLAATSVDTCLACPAGTEQPATGATSLTSCTDCIGGTYATLPGTATCDSCLPGEFVAGPAARRCEACPLANYCPTAGTATPLPCLGGTYGDEEGLDTCKDCSLGSYSLDGAEICTNCTSGTYSATPNANSATFCIDCEPGEYGPFDGMSSCLQCPGGTYSSATGQTDISTCQECALGFEQPIPGSTVVGDCQPCFPGSFANETGTANCLLCPAGSYSDAVQATTADICEPCPAGFASATEGATSLAFCFECDIGSYAAPFSAQCENCTAGTYSDTPQATSADVCFNCPGTMTSLEKSTKCFNCLPDEEFSVSGSSYCEACNTDIDSDYNRPDLLTNRFCDTLGGGNCAGWSGGHTRASGGREGRGSADDMGALLSGSTELTQTVTLNQVTPATLYFGAAYKLLDGITLANPNRGLQAIVNYNDGTTVTQEIAFGTGFMTSYAWVAEYILAEVPIVDVTIRAFNQVESFMIDDLTLVEASRVACSCPPGYEQFEDQLGNCRFCDAGVSCSNGLVDSCDDKPDDNWMSFGGALQCERCKPGWICADGIGQACPEGTFTNDTVTCEACPLGYKCVNGVAEQCGPGTYGTGADRCTPCTPGSFTDSYGQFSCQNCTAGQTSNYNFEYCFDCPPGTSSVAGDECRSCPAGHYADEWGMEDCLECPVDTFADCDASMSCMPCPDGMSTLGGTGAIMCT